MAEHDYQQCKAHEISEDVHARTSDKMRLIIHAKMFYMAGSLRKLFQPHGNGQKHYRILDPEFRDPGRIYGFFLEILVRHTTKISRK